MAGKIDLSDLPQEFKNLLVDKLSEPKGFVRVRRKHPTRDIWVMELPWDENLVTDSGRDALADQLGGIISADESGPITPTAWTTLAEAQSFSITRALVGSGGDSGGVVPPTLSDTDLFTFDYELALAATTRPSQTSIAFQFTIPAAGPNTPFSEFGLGTKGNGVNGTWTPIPGDYTHRLVTHKTFGNINKIAGWEYQITWIVVF